MRHYLVDRKMNPALFDIAPSSKEAGASFWGCRRDRCDAGSSLLRLDREVRRNRLLVGAGTFTQPGDTTGIGRSGREGFSANFFALFPSRSGTELGALLLWHRAIISERAVDPVIKQTFVRASSSGDLHMETSPAMPASTIQTSVLRIHSMDERRDGAW